MVGGRADDFCIINPSHDLGAAPALLEDTAVAPPSKANRSSSQLVITGLSAFPAQGFLKCALAIYRSLIALPLDH